jgi:hypothetical protein
MEWQMYGSDYSTHGAYFGVKKACEPVHVQLDQPDLDVTVVNNTTRSLDRLRLTARVIDVTGAGISTREQTVTAPSNAAVRVFRLDVPGQATDGVVFVKLTLADEAGRVLAENFYWQAAQKSGYRKLNDMAEVSLDCSAVLKTEGEAVRVEVELTNRGPGVALAAQVVLRDASSRARVLPAYAGDNFFSLLPGEGRRVTVEAPAPARRFEVEVKGWNVRRAFVPVTAAR